ncbi:MAG: hypothetical protein NUV84_01745 [Candidatus Uhrbacteria bacterium]|nr:hypothetical protein [Candidatus Uhrbacteria bacterium]
MQLQPVSLRGRRFFIQFYEVMVEFGGVIPWLDGLDEMRFATNGEWFCDELLARLGQRQGRVTPYQFVEVDDARTFVGGILHFDISPEHLRDRHNIEIVERLTNDGASYISCLQVREPRRGTGVGNEMMRRAMKAILAKYGSVWGVVSNPRLLLWYASLGATLKSPPNNQDDLWVVSWSNRSQRES